MDLHFVPVVSDDDRQKLTELAETIWFEYWPDLIGIDQTKYMVEKFQSREAIDRDMATADYEYWFIEVEEVVDGEFTLRTVGYTGGHVEPETNRFFISKIYLLANERGKHYSSETIRFYATLCRERGLRACYLTVNKGNDLAIRAYKAKGFKVIDKVVTDIGSGFVMDDYIMQLDVSQPE